MKHNNPVNPTSQIGRYWSNVTPRNVWPMSRNRSISDHQKYLKKHFMPETFISIDNNRRRTSWPFPGCAIPRHKTTAIFHSSTLIIPTTLYDASPSTVTHLMGPRAVCDIPGMFERGPVAIPVRRYGFSPFQGIYQLAFPLISLH